MPQPIDDPSESAAAATAKLQQLGIELDPDLPYRLDTMFPRLEGWGAKGELKRKGKVIRNVQPRIAEMLRPGEEILYIAKGVQYSFAEHYFMGIWAMTINQTVFVLTNVRLLMIRTNSDGRPKLTDWMIYYSQIDKLKGSWTGMLSLKLRDGKSLQFSGFSKSDRQTMPQVFEDALEEYRARNFDPRVTQSMENLCGYCHTRVPKDEYDCRRCGATFWRPMPVAIRTLFIPSWGDFCLKHYVVAAAELFGYAVTWIVVIAVFIGALNERDPVAVIGAMLFAAIRPGIFHGMDATITYCVAKMGLHPRTGPVHEADESLEAVPASNAI